MIRVLQSFLKQILKRVFPPASVVIIEGDWKTGKTDFALKLIEYLFQLNMIKKFSSNIWLDPEQIQQNNIPFTFISSIPNLKKWAIPPTGDNKSKAYIYDEAVSSSPSRRAMSKLNIEWLKLIPELSKGRLKLIACVHSTKYMDSVFLDYTYLRGIFHKTAKKNKETIVKSYAELVYPRTKKIIVCKRTGFKFDPYRTALMQTEPTLNGHLDDKLSILVDYTFKNKNFSQIGRERKLYPMQVRREFKTALKYLLEESANRQI